MNIRKMSVVIPISDEILNPRVRPGHLEPPTAEELNAYRAWKAKFQPLYDQGIAQTWFRDGGPDYGAEYNPPEGRWVFDDEAPA